jgi:DNA repair protein RecO (recombination protein O)
MPLVVTDAIVLHAFDYLESSRILRLVTRDAGLRSALARGARKSTKRFGAALGLFAQGSAELHTKPGRDLDTLSAFDVQRSRGELAGGLGRFAAANMIAELVMRFGSDNSEAGLFEAVAQALDDIGAATPDQAATTGIAGAWRILAELGFEPAVDRCAECHTELAAQAPALFSHPAGGTLCARCGQIARTGRTLPAPARAALADWLSRRPHELEDTADVRAHQRLLREFVREHLSDDKPLRAFDAWEAAGLTAASAAVHVAPDRQPT